MCGRRWGKTTLGVYLCVKGALDQGGIYWWVAPKYKLARVGWRALKKLARQLSYAFPKDSVVIHEADRYVSFDINGQVSEIYIQSADDEDGLRSEGLNGVVLDEAAQIAEERWTEELRPALADKQGWALFIGTPKGDNWFSQYYEKSLLRPGWMGWKYTSYDNPFIAESEIDEAKSIMSEDEFAQEMLADVRASKYLVYPTFDRELHRWLDPIPKFVQFVGGLDFGGTAIGSHKSAGLLAGRTQDDTLILLEEFEQAGPNIAERQIDWMATCHSAVRELNKQGLGPKDIIWAADKTQMFGIQIMRGAGYSIIPSKGGKDSVMEGITLVQRRLQFRESRAGLYYLPHLHFLPDAFERYRYPEPEDLGEKQQANKPIKAWDDLMDTLRYLVERADLLSLGDPAVLYRNALAVVQ